jgi:hypothetical protein
MEENQEVKKRKVRARTPKRFFPSIKNTDTLESIKQKLTDAIIQGDAGDKIRFKDNPNAFFMVFRANEKYPKGIRLIYGRIWMTMNPVIINIFDLYFIQKVVNDPIVKLALQALEELYPDIKNIHNPDDIKNSPYAKYYYEIGLE